MGSDHAQTIHARMYVPNDVARLELIDVSQDGSPVTSGIEKVYVSCPYPTVSVVIGKLGTVQEKLGVVGARSFDLSPFDFYDFD